MSRILLIASGPLPGPRERVVTAVCHRAEHFRTVLAEAGHRVTTVLLETPGAEEDEATDDRGAVLHRPRDSWDEEAMWADLVREVAPEAVVATSFHASLVLPLLPSQLPKWCDLFGDLFAEAQVKEAATGEDSWRDDHLWPALSALGAADVYSTVSERQRLAALGQLGLAGRLTGTSLGHRFVHAIPLALPRPPRPPGRAPDGSGRVFLGGSFNHWIDDDLLLQAMIRLRSRGVRWVMTGGRIEGHNELLFERFLRRLEDEGLDGEVEVLGWVPARELPAILDGCHVGLNVDRECVETELGSRSRILSGLAEGLPFVSTRGTELVERLEAAGLIVGCDRPGDAVAEAVGSVLDRPQEARDSLGRRGSRLQDHYDPARVAAPLLRWADAPLTSPDRSTGSRLRSLVEEDVPRLATRLVREQRRARALEEHADVDPAELHELREQRAALEAELATAWARVEEVVEQERRARADLEGVRADLEGVRAELAKVHDSLTWRLLRRLDRLLGRGPRS